MHRFHLPPEQCRGSVLTLTGGEAHHAARVLRVQPGERVTVLDGAGGEFLCEVGEANKRTVSLKVLQKKSWPPLPFQITLLQAVPKGKVIESIIQKATELGAHRIVPILSARVTTRLDGADAAGRRDKWQQVAVEAVKQCGAAWLPKVEAPLTQQAFLARRETFDLALVGSLQPDAGSPRECFREFQSRHNGALPRSVCVWIGPEGDFTADELAAIQRAGAAPISLGPLVLRTETAAIYCLSVVTYELNSSPK